MTAANTYTGGTSVYSGRLLVNNTTGSGTGAGSVTVGFPGFSKATLGGSGRIAPAPGHSVTIYPGSRIEPGSGADTSLRIETTDGGRIAIGLDFRGGEATWAVRVTAAGTGDVAANSGGSSAVTAGEPTNHSFLDLSGGGPGTVSIAPNTVIEIDGTGAEFVGGQQYSYRIGRTGAGELAGGPLALTAPANFLPVGFTGSNFSLTSDPVGDIFLNFTVTPVSEPGAVLFAAAAGLGVLSGARRSRLQVVTG